MITKLDDLELKTISGNAIPVERVSLQADELRWLIAKVRQLRRALEPFALVTDFEIDERYALAGKLLVADIQRARRALED